jgi:hypothetical protein
VADRGHQTKRAVVQRVHESIAERFGPFRIECGLTCQFSHEVVLFGVTKWVPSTKAQQSRLWAQARTAP